MWRWVGRTQSVSVPAGDATDEIATLRAAIEAAKVLIRERDLRVERLEMLAQFHFGSSTYELLRARDQRIADLEGELEAQRKLAEQREETFRKIASELWQQTERLQTFEAELREQLRRESA